MPSTVSLKEFFKESGVILDVRSPIEYQQGHIPSSYSLPLFNDEERSQIGTVYKKEGRQQAVELGLTLLLPKLDLLMDRASSLLSSSIGKMLCWRGGMRSGAFARLLEFMGYTILTLQGGYKSYRRWALQRLNELPSLSSLRVLGGLTGSGKTAILHDLQKIGEQVIDLESLTNHQGSAFGGIGHSQQPTQEQFENDLAYILEHLDWSKPIWIEDESRMIGRCRLPTSLYQGILQAPLFYIERPHSYRLHYLLDQYKQATKEQLRQATERLTKRLGGQLAKEIIQLIDKEQRKHALKLLLSYYDKTYQYQMARRQVIHSLPRKDHASSYEWACTLQTFSR